MLMQRILLSLPSESHNRHRVLKDGLTLVFLMSFLCNTEKLLPAQSHIRLFTVSGLPNDIGGYLLLLDFLCIQISLQWLTYLGRTT